MEKTDTEFQNRVVNGETISCDMLRDYSELTGSMLDRIIESHPEIKVPNDFSTFMFATKNKSIKLLQHLLTNGYGPETPFTGNLSPLSAAVNNRWTDGILLLIEHNFKIDVQLNGGTLLHTILSCYSSLPEILNLLPKVAKELGDINAVAEFDSVPMVFAARCSGEPDDKLQLMTVIILYGADVNWDRYLLLIYDVDDIDNYVAFLKLLISAGLRRCMLDYCLVEDPYHELFESEQFKIVYKIFKENPLSLRELTRIVIKDTCGPRYIQLLKSSIVPKSIAKYLAFDYDYEIL